MKFLIITYVEHIEKNREYYAYAPYVREMNLWLKHVDELIVLAPKTNDANTSSIDLNYEHSAISFIKIPKFDIKSFISVLKSTCKIPVIICKMISAIRKSDHIHLRCPGNVSLLGCIVQIFFPRKTKTVKYAGNWDPKSKQPLSYKLQKWILSNTFLTKNCKVLVYGEWPNQTKNIKPFFTATFKDSEKASIIKKEYDKLWNFVFVGSLVEGKRPLLAIQIIGKLYNMGYKVNLDIYGNGLLMEDLKKYITENNLQNSINLHGNKSKEVLKKAYKEAHFSLLLSKSEGWPKALAEAMFFGAIPIATSISCIPYMLDYGKRGVVVEPEVNKVVKVLKSIRLAEFEKMSINAATWSQKFTLDVFESEIKKLI